MWASSLIHSVNTSGYLLYAWLSFSSEEAAVGSQVPALRELMLEWGRQSMNRYVMCWVVMNAVTENKAM